jgi:hypothetical protein
VGEMSFDDWWEATSKRVEVLGRRGFDSVIILGAWSIWKHRNRCVSDGCSPSLNGVFLFAVKDLRLWSFAGAKGVSHLLA